MNYDILVIISVFLFIYSCVASYYSIRFAMIILNVEDEIEYSLEELEKSSLKLSEILKKPIFFDSIEVRQCMQEIGNTERLINTIAQRLSSISKNNITAKEEDKNGKESREEKSS